ncbi:MAG: endonuclease III domain-containing protein, partial [Thermoplasmata archaeon]
DLFRIYGELGWWPAQSREEVLIGAILTQNTNWKNVEKAIENMKKNGILTLSDINKIETERLSEIIKSSGFHNQKAERLKILASLILQKYGKLENMKDLSDARSFLSSIKGIGPETRDSILLYALDFPVFVIDSYTIRFLSRYSNIDDYGNLATDVTKNIPTVDRLKNFHGMIVQVSKDYCRKDPLCDLCPINEKCMYAKSRNISRDYANKIDGKLLKK